MHLRVIRSASAGMDLVEAYARIGRHDPRRGDRFLNAFEATVARVAEMPGIGSPYPTHNPALRDLRRIPVRGFKIYQILYLAGDELLEVVRILHGSRDIRSILEHEN